MSQSAAVNELLLHFPGLTAVQGELKEACLQGNIKFENKWYYVEMICPASTGNRQQMRINIGQNHRLRTYTIDYALGEALKSFQQFIRNLPVPTDLAASGESTTEATPIPAVPLGQQQNNIYAEVAKLFAPDAYRMQLNAACTRVHFSQFAEHEQHYLELELPTLHINKHSLPADVPWEKLLQKCLTLSALLEQFQKYLEELQPFYENLSSIDELCYVVQPAAPTTKDNWRLFVLRERVFLKLLISDPLAPVPSMSLHIIGPTYEVEALRRIYSDGMSNWDAELDIHTNLLRIFNLCFFPMAPASDDAEVDAGRQHFCNICYCYKLEQGEIPLVSCDNPNCSLIFHAECLKEWFNTLTDGKQFLNVSLGTCPLCKAKLSTSFAELLGN